MKNYPRENVVEVPGIALLNDVDCDLDHSNRRSCGELNGGGNGFRRQPLKVNVVFGDLNGGFFGFWSGF